MTMEKRASQPDGIWTSIWYTCVTWCISYGWVWSQGLKVAYFITEGNGLYSKQLSASELNGLFDRSFVKLFDLRYLRPYTYKYGPQFWLTFCVRSWRSLFFNTRVFTLSTWKEVQVEFRLCSRWCNNEEELCKWQFQVKYYIVWNASYLQIMWYKLRALLHMISQPRDLNKLWEYTGVPVSLFKLRTLR
jgi:hypothetical protein